MSRVRHGEIVSITQVAAATDRVSLVGWRVWDLPRGGSFGWRTPDPSSRETTWDDTDVQVGDLLIVCGQSISTLTGFTQTGVGSAAWWRVADGTASDRVSGSSTRPVFTTVLRHATTTGLLMARGNAGTTSGGSYDTLDWTGNVHNDVADVGALQMLFCGLYGLAGAGSVQPGDHAYASYPYTDSGDPANSRWGVMSYQNPATPTLFAKSGAMAAFQWIDTLPQAGPLVTPVFYQSASTNVAVQGFYWRVRANLPPESTVVTVRIDGQDLVADWVDGSLGSVGDIATLVQDDRRLVLVASRAP